MSATPAPNRYSPRWFETFLGEVDAGVVSREVAFLERQLPGAEFKRVLDLCCGVGRHALPLAEAGYRVMAIDRDADVLRAARNGEPASSANVEWVRADMRMLPTMPGSLDAIVCMWQSFGYFDHETNRNVLHECARALRAGGRLVLDLYHRAFHEARPLKRGFRKEGIDVFEERGMDGDRFRVWLQYMRRTSAGLEDLSVDVFDWQLYTPAEIAADATAVGLELRTQCSEFDETHPVTADSPRMQLVLTRRSQL